MVTILVSITIIIILLGTVGIYKLKTDARVASQGGDIQNPEISLISEKEFRYIVAEIIFLIFLVFVLGGMTIWLIIQI